MFTQCLVYAILLTLQSHTIEQAQLQSFGMMVENSLIDANNHSKVFLRLNWDTHAYHCNASIHNNTYYSCFINDISTKTCNYANYVSSNGLQSITISINPIDESLTIDSIIINMDDNSYYIINTFCIEQNVQYIGYNQIHSTNCTDFNQQNEYENIMINNTTTSITVYFMDNILLWTNSNESGLIKSTKTYNLDDIMLNAHCEGIKIATFGFHAYDTMDSPHDDDVIVTLYWFDQILQCIILKPIGGYGAGQNEDFICNHTDIQLIGNNADNKAYKIKLEYDHKWALFVSSIIIIDMFGNRYDIDYFCGAQQYDDIKYWRTIIDNQDICHSNYGRNIYRYKHIGMDNDEMFCTQIYANFDENILLNPGNDISARISMPEIIEFGIKTFVSPKYTVNIRLYWDVYLYVCSLDIIDSNQLYLCYISNTMQVTSNCNDPNISPYESQFALTIEINPNNAFQIDYIYIKDATNSIYKIDEFCESLINGYDPNTFPICTDFNTLYKYNVLPICNEINPCNSTINHINSLLAFEFPSNLLLPTKYNALQNEHEFEAYTNFISLYSSRYDLSCNLSVSPTAEPTVNRIRNPTSNPTLHPILNPTSHPTAFGNDTTVIIIHNTMYFGDNKHHMNDDKLLRLMVSILFIAMGCCGAVLMGCCYYNRVLKEQLKQQQETGNNNNGNTDELDKKSDRNETVDKLSGLTSMDLPRTLSKLTTKSISRTRSGLLLKESVHSSLIDAFKKNSTQSILPPGHPKRKNNQSDSSSFVAGDGPNDEEDDDLSIHTDDSQKEEEEEKKENNKNNKNNKNNLYEHMEGYMEETKLESFVHLEVIKAGDNDDNDDDDIDNKQHDVDIVLDGIMVDVLKMDSLDPNKIYKLNTKRTYSDDSDDLYQKAKNNDNGDDEKDDIDHQYETTKGNENNINIEESDESEVP